MTPRNGNGRIHPKIKRFDVYWVNLDPTVGHEIKKCKPAVIVSPDELNRHLGTVLVAPLTSTLRTYPFSPTVIVDETTGQIALDQLRAIDKSRLVRQIATLDGKYRKAVLTLLQEMFR